MQPRVDELAVEDNLVLVVVQRLAQHRLFGLNEKAAFIGVDGIQQGQVMPSTVPLVCGIAQVLRSDVVATQ